MSGRLLSPLWFVLLLAACGATGGEGSKAPSPEQQAALKLGEQAFATNCEACHGGGDPAAPKLAALKQMSQDAIRTALTSGKMMQQGSALSGDEKSAVIAWLTAGQRDYANWEQKLACKSPLVLNATATRWLDRWGVTDDNRRYQRQSSINSGNVGVIRKAWSIAFPGAATMRSQPVILGDALFVAVSDTQSIYAINRQTGCLFWTRNLGRNLRSALSLATMQDGRKALVIGDESGGVSVVEARKGDIIWQKHVGVDRFSAITGPITVRGDVLYIPQSTTETIASVDPKYECCRASGAVSANRLSDGSRIWIHRVVREPAARAKTKDGVAQWGPAGASVWAAPVIDDERGLIFVGTGPVSAPPDEGVGDSVIAIDIKTGKPRWTFQATKNDLWNGACRAPYPGGQHPNCPSTSGVDFDFGAGLIRAQDGKGRDLLIAGQKSGWVFALEPDSGKIIWKTRLGSGGLLGGIHWGMAIANGELFVPVNDPDFSKNPGLAEAYRARIANYKSLVGLYRLDLTTGVVRSKWAPEARCKGDNCPPQFGLSGAAFATNDIILSGGMDGTWHAFGTAGGKPLLETATFGEHRDTLNRVPGTGGSIDNSTLVAADDMIFVQSGYGYFGGSPGNMLIAYRLPEKKPMIRISALVLAALALQPVVPAVAKPSNNAVAAATKSEVGDLLADYGFAADQRDPDAVSALFAEDGVLAIPVVNIEARGRAAIAASFSKTWEPVAAAGQQRRHVITGLRLTGGKGKEHGFRAIMTVVGTARDGTPQLYLNGYYTGIAVRTAQGWRFKRLEIRVDTAR